MMISERKRAANCANARSSTGPRTAAGKTRAAKNALRHGLRSPVLSDPVLMAEVESLAKEIAGGRRAKSCANLPNASLRPRSISCGGRGRTLSRRHSPTRMRVRRVFRTMLSASEIKRHYQRGPRSKRLARIFNQEAARFARYSSAMSDRHGHDANSPSAPSTPHASSRRERAFLFSNP